MAKRVFQAVVLFFAIYAFAFVPLGEKTGLEHVQAIAATPAAHQAAKELKGGVARLVQRLRSDAQRVTESTDEEIEALGEELERQPRERTSSAPKAAARKPALSEVGSAPAR